MKKKMAATTPMATRDSLHLEGLHERKHKAGRQNAHAGKEDRDRLTCLRRVRLHHDERGKQHYLDEVQSDDLYDSRRVREGDEDSFEEGRDEREDEEITVWLAELHVERVDGGEVCGIRVERRRTSANGDEDGVDGEGEDGGEYGEEAHDVNESK